MALKHLHSFMLYSSRDFSPLEDQARELAALGYTNVETFPDLHVDVEETADTLRRHSLSVGSVHIDLQMLETDIDRAVAIAKTLQAGIVVAPWLEPEDRPVDGAGWRALGLRLSGIADRLALHDLALAWHNHDFEFTPLPDGSMPIEHLLSHANVFLELDAAWVHRAGADPAHWIRRLSDRIIIGHVKDVAREGEGLDEDGWADLGAGRVPWEALWPLYLATPVQLMIVEHDQPSDYLRFAKSGLEKVRALSSGAAR